MIRLADTWPVLANQLHQSLLAEGELSLAAGVDDLGVVESCRCGDDVCQSFYTAPKPNGAYGPGHRNVELEAPWPGMLILDVVDEEIAYVEVLDRPPLD